MQINVYLYHCKPPQRVFDILSIVRSELGWIQHRSSYWLCSEAWWLLSMETWWVWHLLSVVKPPESPDGTLHVQDSQWWTQRSLRLQIRWARGSSPLGLRCNLLISDLILQHLFPEMPVKWSRWKVAVTTLLQTSRWRRCRPCGG